MERISFDIERQDVADALHAEAASHGRSIEEEVAALVETTYAGKSKVAKTGRSDNWVRDLVQLATDLELEDGFDGLIPIRTAENYQPPKL